MFGDKETLGTERCGARVQSLAASPECINNVSMWTVAGMQENSEVVHMPMPGGVTTAALTVKADRRRGISS
jgi:hypothetical protein